MIPTVKAKFNSSETGNGSFLFSAAAPGDIFAREDLSPAQKMFGQIAEDFMRIEILPRADAIHAKDWQLTRELLLKAGELDLLRVDIPEAYDGLSLDKVSSAYVGGKIGALPSFAGSLGAHTTIGTLPLVYFGTPKQKAKYLPKLASGEWVAAFCLTEPGAGSDALSIRTKAVLNEAGTHYLLNGQKMWITNGGFADVFTVFAKVDGEKFTAFIVERAMGVESGREEPKLGLDGSSTTALTFSNVSVPVENVLGEIGAGHKVAFNILNIGRVKLGTRNIGSAERALNNALRYALERKQFGKAIVEFGMIRQKLAEMAVRCYVGEAMVYRTLGAVDAALADVDAADASATLAAIERFALECSINKVWSSEALAYVTDEAIQVYGGYGYSKEYPAERAYRDARITRLYEGTNEINRLIIPTRLLRNPTFAVWQPEEWDNNAGEAIPAATDEKFAVEKDFLRRAKRLALQLLKAAAQLYGAGMADEQEILGRIADIVIEIYAIESAVLRAAKLSVRNPASANNDLQSDAVKIYASDAAERIAAASRQITAALNADGTNSIATAAAAQTRNLIELTAYNTVAARRRIAAALVRAGRYHLQIET